MDLSEIVVAAGARLPIGRFGGSLRGFRVYELGAKAIAEAVRRAGVKPEEVNEVFVAHNRQSGNGPNPGRTAAVLAGLPASVPGHTINMACPAGLRAAIEAAQAIRLGECETAVICGMESMSTIPHILMGARWRSFRSGPIVIEDEFSSMVEPLAKMGAIDMAEHTAKKYGVTRREQEEFAVESHRKAATAWEKGWLSEEVVPVEVPKEGEAGSFVFSKDECFRADASIEKMAKLPPARQGGTVTAATASGITDGAGAVVLTTAAKAKKLGVAPLASLVAYEQVGLAPADMLEGPAIAIPKVLRKAGLDLREIDLIEVNEAFAAQMVANERVLGWDRSRVNVHGGAIALGHPTGFTGVRLLLTLSRALAIHGGRYGLIALCGGGGLGIAMIIRREQV
jgi:acetyl-CoA C-acetyltransferase